VERRTATACATSGAGGAHAGQFAYRFTGSSDLYATNGRRPYASINFVTAHDGFTLTDLVSHNEKHNQANGEENRDGESHNRSWNCGAEGPSDDPSILTLRARQRRNFLTTLLLSQGISMLLHGDEIGRTQGGNNNAYCQDNEVSWLDWEHADLELLTFVQDLVHLRRRHPIFQRRRFFHGRNIRGSRVGDIDWLRGDGDEMTEADWNAPFAKSLGVFLNGQALEGVDERGERRTDHSFMFLINAHPEPQPWTLLGGVRAARGPDTMRPGFEMRAAAAGLRADHARGPLHEGAGSPRRATPHAQKTITRSTHRRVGAHSRRDLPAAAPCRFRFPPGARAVPHLRRLGSATLPVPHLRRAAAAATVRRRRPHASTRLGARASSRPWSPSRTPDGLSDRYPITWRSAGEPLLMDVENGPSFLRGDVRQRLVPDELLGPRCSSLPRRPTAGRWRPASWPSPSRTALVLRYSTGGSRSILHLERGAGAGPDACATAWAPSTRSCDGAA
jgi:hypothetical protein